MFSERPFYVHPHAFTSACNHERGYTVSCKGLMLAGPSVGVCAGVSVRVRVRVCVRLSLPALIGASSFIKKIKNSANLVHLSRTTKRDTSDKGTNEPGGDGERLNLKSSVPNLDLYDLNLDPWRYSLDRKKIV